MRKTIPYKVKIDIHGRLTNEEIHNFVENFTERYSGRLNAGEDLRSLYDFELEAFVEGVSVFYIDTTYKNEAGIEVTVKSRGDGFLVVEYEGELYRTDTLFIEEGVECAICSDIMFWADQIYNENEMNEQ